MQLFEKLILGEAVPTNPKDPNQQQQPDPNVQSQPDPNQPPMDPNQQDPNMMQQPEGMDPNAPQDPNAMAPADDGSMQDPNAAAPMDDGSGGEVPADDGSMQDPNADPNAGMDGGMEPAAPADDLDPAQDPTNFDIKPEQMNIKVTELKNQYKKLNSVITSALEKLDKISHTTYDSAMIEFITRKLMELKDYSKDFLLKSFNTKTYIENQIELQRMIVTFNLITNLVSQIKDSRVKRQEIIADRNQHLFKAKKSNPLVFSRGYELA